MSSGGASISDFKLGAAFDFSDANCTNNLTGVIANDLSRTGNTFGFSQTAGSPFYTLEANKRGAMYFTPGAGGWGYMDFGATYYPSDSILSFCMWMKTASGTGTNRSVVGKWGTAKPYLLCATTSSVGFYVNGSLTASVSYNVDTTVWRYVAISYNMSTMKLFVDGNLVNSIPYTSSIVAGASGQNMALGRAFADFDVYGGHIGTFYFYSRSLADSEIVDIYNNQKNRFI